jgi:hypothetical protein
MTDRLTPVLEELLEKHAKNEREAERRDAITAQRALDAARMVMVSTERGVNHYIRAAEPEDEDEQQRLPSRAYVAGILSLIGLEDSNAGHLATPRIVVARNVNRYNAVYSEVGVSLTGVALVSYETQDIHPRTVAPEEIVEGKAVMFTRQGDDAPKYAGGVGAWIANHDMPAHYMGRENYVDPGQLGRVAQTMLRAMMDPSLNPQFHTLEFVQGVSKELGAAVLDHSVADKDLHASFVLPSWLPNPDRPSLAL